MLQYYSYCLRNVKFLAISECLPYDNEKLLNNLLDKIYNMNSQPQNKSHPIWHSAKKEWRENPIRTSLAIAAFLGLSGYGIWLHRYVSEAIKTSGVANIPLLVFALLSASLAFLLFRSKKIIKSPSDKHPNTDKETYNKENLEDQFKRSMLPWKFHDKISLSIGAYHDVLTKHGKPFFRITLKDISRKNMPPPYESDHTPEEITTDVATVGFTHGFMLAHGSRIKKVETSPFFDEYCYDMTKIENDEEDRYSVFFFKTEHVDDGEFFFRCYVDHINPIKKEAELNIYFIWTTNSNAELSMPIKPASASSEPGPDDYHATRRSFFHSDNERPRRS